MVFLLTCDCSKDIVPLLTELQRWGAQPVTGNSWLVASTQHPRQLTSHFAKFLAPDDAILACRIWGTAFDVRAAQPVFGWLEDNPAESGE